MSARDELPRTLRQRYGEAERSGKSRILDEFVSVTGHHRKHAIRLLRGSGCPGCPVGGLGPDLRQAPAGLAAVSCGGDGAAWASGVVRRCAGRRRRCVLSPTSVRRRIPVRAGQDWQDPAPGFMEGDLVAHSGPVACGSFLQTLVITDVATGWTECAPVLYREQTLVRETLAQLRRRLPFDLLGFDVDNDSVFMNETLLADCEESGIEFTRSRPWHKNDQALVEQKNGSVVRRIVGYRRLEGLAAAAALSRLYGTVRLFVNFFQPSFKLSEKTRDGSLVRKRYHRPATPCRRLLEDARTSQAVRDAVTELQERLDPVLLLQQMRRGQQEIADLADGVPVQAGPEETRERQSR